MPKASPSYNLYLLKPLLVREWHIRKNRGLTPKDVTPGSGKKVWWICGQGHEWEAVIYSRSRGSGCPYCSRLRHTGFQNLVSKRSLLKEWHPTRNGTLNPRNLESGYSGKLWWICENGHEWQATMKRRLKGEGCPSCIVIDYQTDGQFYESAENSKLRLFDVVDTWQEDDALGLDFSDHEMDFRKSKRFSHTITGVLEDSITGYLVYAKMRNYSQEGMYFESETAFQPETNVKVKLEKPLNRFSRTSFNAVVKWCHELFGETGSEYMFGLGVEFI